MFNKNQSINQSITYPKWRPSCVSGLTFDAGNKFSDHSFQRYRSSYEKLISEILSKSQKSQKRIFGK